MARKTQIRRLPVFPAQAPRRMNVMLNVLRHEPAQVILALMEKGKYTGRKLTKKCGGVVGLPFSSTKYLEDVLVTSSLVDKFYFGMDSQSLYSLNPAAETKGIPVVDFNLRYSVENDFWLGDIFGRSLVKDIKTCGRRYVILHDLYHEERPVSKQFLQIGTYACHQTVSRDLACLGSLGLIDSEVVDVDSVGFNTLEWRGRNVELTGSQKYGERKIADFLRRSNRASLGEIASETRLPTPTLVHAVYGLLDGGLIRATDKFPIKKKYEISVSDKGRQLWEGYFAPLYEFLSDRETLQGFRDEDEKLQHLKYAMKIFRDRTGK